MQGDDSSENKQIHRLQEMWQQSITNDSLKIKEREMINSIQHQMDMFDNQFGLGTWKMSSMNGFMAVFFLLIATRDFMRDSKANIPFVLLAIMQGVMFLFHTLSRIKKNSYDMGKAQDYIAYNLQRVQLQILLTKITPILVLPIFVVLYWYYPISQDSWEWRMIILALPIIGVAWSVWQYKNKLIPLRTRLKSALQQLNEPQLDHTA